MILDKKFMQPGEVKDFPTTYVDWLAENAPTDTLASATASIAATDGGLNSNLVLSSLVVSPTAVAPWLTAVAAGKFKVTVRVTTAAGRIDEFEFTVTVKDN